MEILKNDLWDIKKGRVTVITPVFNRPNELVRAMNSIKNQTYNDFEYIIINDGSTIDLDSYVKDFILTVKFPVCYIKKNNGGVHTARNLGISYARGEMIANCDSDDELLPNALEILIGYWDKIDPNKKQNYREICARVIDENGIPQGKKFPDNINILPWRKAQKISKKTHGEHYGFWRRDTLLECPWPEPEGITFVTESLVWKKLSTKYRSYFINDPVRCYHLENADSYTRTKKWTIQTVVNKCWNESYRLNRWEENHERNLFEHLKVLFKFLVYKKILKILKFSDQKFELARFCDRLFALILCLPSTVLAKIYIRKRNIE